MKRRCFVKKSSYSVAAVSIFGAGVGLANGLTSEIQASPYVKATGTLDDDEVTHNLALGKGKLLLLPPGESSGASFWVSTKWNGAVKGNTDSLILSGSVDTTTGEFSTVGPGASPPLVTIYSNTVPNVSKYELKLKVKIDDTTVTATSKEVEGTFSIVKYEWTWDSENDVWVGGTPQVEDSAAFTMKVEKVDPANP